MLSDHKSFVYMHSFQIKYNNLKPYVHELNEQVVRITYIIIELYLYISDGLKMKTIVQNLRTHFLHITLLQTANVFNNYETAKFLFDIFQIIQLYSMEYHFFIWTSYLINICSICYCCSRIIPWSLQDLLICKHKNSFLICAYTTNRSMWIHLFHSIVLSISSAKWFCPK